MDVDFLARFVVFLAAGTVVASVAVAAVVAVCDAVCESAERFRERGLVDGTSTLAATRTESPVAEASAAPDDWEAAKEQSRKGEDETCSTN